MAEGHFPSARVVYHPPRATVLLYRANYLLSRATPGLVHGPERAALVLHLNSIGAVAHGPSRFERDPSTGLRSTPSFAIFTPSASTKMSACIVTDQGSRLLLPLITLI